MTRSRKRRILISTAQQHEAIASTVRIELIEQLGAAGPSTVADLARRMGRTPHSLYHHVKRLRETGFVIQVDTRRSGAREQAVYDVAADVFEVPQGPVSEAAREADAKTVRVILRKAERESVAALDTCSEELRAGAFFIGRMRASLGRQAQRDVLRHISAIREIFAAELKDPPPRSKTRPCSFSAAFVPSPSSAEPSSK